MRLFLHNELNFNEIIKARLDKNTALFFNYFYELIDNKENTIERTKIDYKKQSVLNTKCPSPDSSENPFMPGFGIKDCNE
jgi:hypothetical protein